MLQVWHHPSPKPNSWCEKIKNGQSLVCATCLKNQLLTMSRPDCSDTVQNSYVGGERLKRKESCEIAQSFTVMHISVMTNVKRPTKRFSIKLCSVPIMYAIFYYFNVKVAKL